MIFKHVPCIFLCELWTPPGIQVWVLGSRLPQLRIFTICLKRKSQNTFLINFFVKFWTLSRAPVLVQGSRLIQFSFYTIWGSLHRNVVVFKQFLNMFSKYIYVTPWTSWCPSISLGSRFLQFGIYNSPGWMHSNILNCS